MMTATQTSSKRNRWSGSTPVFPKVAIISGIAFMIALTGLIMSGATRGLDEASLIALRRAGDLAIPIGPSWLLHAVPEINSLGSVTVLAIITVLATIHLLLSRMKESAGFLLVSVLGGWAISNAVKFAVDRPRPTVVPHLMAVYDPSFPSGHAMMSAIGYLTIAALLSQASPGRSQRAFFVTVAGLLTFVIGLCRIYLGVHYPTDVLAGWCLGATWSLFMYRAANRILTGRIAH